MPSTNDPYRSYHLVAAILSLATVAIATLVLIGWIEGIPTLTSLVPELASMKVTTAFGFLCAATSVLMLNATRSETGTPRQSRRLLSALPAAVAALLGSGTLIGYAVDIAPKSAHPAWMSPSTAVSFILFALAVVTFQGKTRAVQRISEAAVLLMVGINGLALVGYLYNKQVLYTFGLHTSTALHTALSFVLLGAALFCVRPDRGIMADVLSRQAGGLMLRRMVPLTLGMVAAIGWLHLASEPNEWFDRTFGLTVVVALNMGGFSLILWIVARSLNRADRLQGESQIRLQLAKDAADLGIHDYDVIQGTIQWDERVRELWGVGPEEPITMDTFWAGVHPDDRETTKASMDHALDPAGDGRYHAEFRVLSRTDGRLRWIEGTGRTIFERSRAVRLVGTVQDITERKQWEEALRESEERFAKAFRMSPHPIGITDVAAGRCIEVNDACLQLFGFSREEVIGSTTLTLGIWPNYDDRARLVERLKTGEPVRNLEASFRTKSGEIRHILVSSDLAELNGTLCLITSGNDITERKQAEAKLRESEERFRTFFENAAVGAAQINRAGRFIHVNKRFCRITGYAREELLGKMGPLDLDHPEDIETDRKRLADFFQGNHDYLFYEKRYLHKNRHVVWVRVTVAPIHDDRGVVQTTAAIVEDITERKQAEARLRESEERLRLAMESSHMGAWDIELASGIVSWDAKQHELFGQDKAPPDMDAFYAFLHPDDVDRIKQGTAAAETTGEFFEEFRIIRPDGSVRWLVGHGAIVHDERGRPLRMVGVNYDITDRKEAQFRLERFAEELEQRVTVRTCELLDSEAMLRALATELNLTEQRERKRIATELHDHLQQMLVLGRLKLGMHKRFAETAPAAAKVMKETDEVLSEALQYTRTLVAELSPTVLRDHGLAAGLRWLGEYMKKHEITVTVTVPEEELKLPEDQVVLLFQSVRELLINSSKHAGTGEATVIMEQQEGNLSITVSDRGKGFDLAAAAAAAAGTPSGGISSKFGLFSIQERMRALGGSCVLESAPGQGTTATLVLPLVRAAEDNPSAQDISPASIIRAARTVRKSSSRTKRRTMVPVLLVDDHAMVRQGLRAVLDAYDDLHVIAEAADGAEAVQLVEDLRPRVVVMDINMPRMNGIDATAHIKTHWPETTVIGISVNTGDDISDAMKRAGAVTVLPKDTAVNQLYDAIIHEVGGSVDKLSPPH